MKISIDEDVVNSTKTYDGIRLTPAELLTCIIVKLGYNPAELTENLLRKGVLISDSDSLFDNLLIYEKYSKLIESILLESDKIVPKKDSIGDLVTTLQELFPKGRKCDDNGIPKWSWRGNKKDVTTRLQAFFKLYGQYSPEDIIEATRRYVKRMSGDKFMRILPYFIMAQHNEKSDLADELGTLDTDEPTEHYIGEVLTA